MCISNRDRSPGGSSSSRYSVTSSTSSLQLISVTAVTLHPVEVALQLTADLRARSVQQDPLVRVADLERCTYLLRGPAFDIAHRDDDPLALGKPLDRLAHARHRLLREQPFLWDVP